MLFSVMWMFVCTEQYSRRLRIYSQVMKNSNTHLQFDLKK